MQNRLLLAIFGFLLLGALALAAMAQTAGTSRVTGSVQDQRGAVVPSATAVVLTNEGGNVSFPTARTSAGVQRGNYSLTAERSGFKKFVPRSNVLSLGR